MVLVDSHISNLKSLISEIPDPEVPVITIAELGILREVIEENGKIIVTITPTYSGCPAMKAIENEIADILKANSVSGFEIKYTFSPAWTTDWLSDSAKEKLRVYGIAPPEKSSSDKTVLFMQQKTKSCPRCSSTNTEMISAFGSTACK
ncbi:MAG: 1,2-phenylacetyl-CoA epoxidase subunit PaaD, partial [Bacteroidota bacterium]